MRRGTLQVTLVVVVLLAAGCGPAGPGAGPTDAPEPSGPGDPTEPAATEPAATEPASGPVPGRVVEPIVADLAERLQVDQSAIAVASVERRTWSDGSLGCPRPGRQYTQALVPGYRVILRAEGREFDYRASDAGGFTLCERPFPRRS